MSDPGAVLADAMQVALDAYHAAITPPPPPVPVPVPGGLPGQVQWRNGANNLLFGSNDTFKWPTLNPMTSPKIRQLMKDAGVGVVRQWFSKYLASKPGPLLTSDAQLDAQMKVSEEIGAVCIGVLVQWQDADWCKHVVTLLGDRCLIYEFGNEPYGEDYPTGTWQSNVANYAKWWAQIVPPLRAINPAAKFIGPVSPDPVELDVFVPAMKAAGCAPDAISFHFYTVDVPTMLGKIAHARAVTDRVYGPSMPIGLTEWHMSGDPRALPAAVADPKASHDYVVAMQHALVSSGLSFACHFDIANQTTKPSLDLFDVTGITSDTELSADRIGGSYYGLKDVIAEYRP